MDDVAPNPNGELVTDKAKFEIVGSYLCEWVNKCTCGGYSDPYWQHEPGCGLEPAIPLKDLEKLLAPPRVFFPGDTVPAGTEVRTELGNVYRWNADRELRSYFGPVVELFEQSHDKWRAAVARARAEREGDLT